MQFKSPRSLYNHISEKYSINRGKASNDLTELPAALNLLGDLQNKKVLDMGCGLGKHAYEFIKRGAKVTGYDASEKMVELTKKYCGDKGSFFTDTHEKVSFKPESFDCINASYTLGYSNKLPLIFEKVKKWLRQDGLFTFSIPHPLWLLKRVENMDYSKAHKIEINIDAYGIEVFNYYYPLDFYIQIINVNHFKLLNIIETTIPRSYKGKPEEKYRIPNALVFKLQKVK